MHSRPKAGKEKSDRNRWVDKANERIDVSAEQNVSIGANGDGRKA